MNIAVVYEDDTENEFEIEICCASCAMNSHAWTMAQFDFVCKKMNENQAIKIPSSVISEKEFIQFVRTIA